MALFTVVYRSRGGYYAEGHQGVTHAKLALFTSERSDKLRSTPFSRVFRIVVLSSMQLDYNKHATEHFQFTSMTTRSLRHEYHYTEFPKARAAVGVTGQHWETNASDQPIAANADTLVRGVALPQVSASSTEGQLLYRLQQVGEQTLSRGYPQ